jgi:hypothetical protein
MFAIGTGFPSRMKYFSSTAVPLLRADSFAPAFLKEYFDDHREFQRRFP